MTTLAELKARPPKYRWEITRDHLYEHDKDAMGWKSRVGTKGPRLCSETMDNRATWACYDDDGVLYYEGVIYGDYDGFEPLDDFCMPDAGCTSIKLNGEWL